MNFLSHHFVALRSSASGAYDKAPEFYVGNVLPDLIAMSGVSRVRPEHLIDRPTSLAQGMALHFESDRHFHTLPVFAEAQRAAKSLLLAAPFETPPKRTFFLAHVLVEIALDRFLLGERPGIAHDFYAQFETADLPAVVCEVKTILRTENSLAALTDVLSRFALQQYLFEYSESAGCADALHRICRRAGLIGFPASEARATLAAIFDAFAPTIQNFAEALLSDDREPQSMVQ